MEIYVDEFALTPKRFIAGTKGSYGFCTMCFRFGSEWDGLAKKVTFYPLDGGDPVYLIVSDDKVEIPQEIMRCAGVNRYVVSGCKNEDVLISITGEIDVLDSLSPDGVNAEEPTPTQMEQVMTMMQRAIDVAQSVRDDADNGVFDGEKGDTGEKGEQGEKGERGEKGEKGDTGEVTLDYANNTFANALKGTANGEVIAISDASPIEHKMAVRVRKKNYLDISKLAPVANGTLTIEGDKLTVTTSTQEFPGGYYEIRDPALFGKTFALSCSYEILEKSEGDETYKKCYASVEMNVRNKQNAKVFSTSLYGARVSSATRWQKATLPEYEDGMYITIGVYAVNKLDGSAMEEGRQIVFSNLQLEEGTAVTAYAPYIEDISTVKVMAGDGETVSKQYNVNTDGTVDGVTSIYPNMTLSTDTQGAVIDCTYNRDINKAFEELYNAIISTGGNV